MEYPVYATTADVVALTGRTLESLPANIDFLLAEASDLITNRLLVTVTEEHTEPLRRATVFQVDFLLNNGAQALAAAAAAGQIKSWKAGEMSVTYAVGDEAVSTKTIDPVCDRAKQYLMTAGLLYRGVRVR